MDILTARCSTCGNADPARFAPEVENLPTRPGERRRARLLGYRCSNCRTITRLTDRTRPSDRTDRRDADGVGVGSDVG